MQLEVAQEPAHTRCLSVSLVQGQGESVDFRADILDLRKSGLMQLAGRIATAGIIHKMALRGSFSSAEGTLERIEWDQSHVMHEANAATKGECCRDPMSRLEGLVGTRIGTDFAGQLKLCFGGPLGCTHVNTLLQELSAFVVRVRAAESTDEGAGPSRQPGDRIGQRSLFFDALFPEAADANGGPATSIDTTTIRVRLTDAHRARCDAQGHERLASHDEVRLVADVELAGWRLARVEAAERRRQGPTFQAAPWTVRSDELGDFVGRSLGGGMARFCLERFGDREDDALLRSALLSLAPGMTQVAVALSDSLEPSSAARPMDAPLSGPGPCYMLRAEGPLMATIAAGGARSEGGD